MAIMRRLLSFLIVLPTVLSAQQRTFRQPPLLATSSDAAAIATNDWNHDGKADLAYIDSASTPAVHVLLGKGNGSFTEVQTLVLPASSCTYYGTTHECYLQQTDVNGDGKPDLLFASTTGSNNVISVLLGNGDGTFAAPVSSIFSLNSSGTVSPLYLPMALGDYNGDGKLDLVLSDVYNSQLVLFQGDGAGHFTIVSYIQLGLYGQQNPLGAYAGDFNHDGKLDILTFCSPYSGGAAQVLYGDGKGGFSKGPAYSGSTSTTVVLTQFVDVNGDGIPDILGRQGSDVYFLPGQSDGTFGAAQKDIGAISNNQNLLGVADLNGDGKVDLIAQAPAGVSITLGKGAGVFGSPQTISAGNTYPYLMASGDFNGDGVPDIALGVPGGIEFIYGTASGNFASSGIADSGGSIMNIFAGDFNGDGRNELAVLQPGSSTTAATVRTMLNDGAGNLTQGPSTSLGTFSPGSVASGIVADLDGDGRQDLVLNGNPIEVLYGNADGTFTIGTGPVYGGIPFAGDVNKDGKIDIVQVSGPFSDVSFNLYYKLSSVVNSGNRTFTEVDIALPVTYTYPQLVAVGDLNGDGYADAVLYDRGLPGLRIMLGNGDGTFRPGTPISVASALLSYAADLDMKVADIDHDGHNDLVTITPQGTGSSLLVFYGDGSGNFSAPQIIALSHAFTAGFELVDLDKDGLLDVVASSGTLLATLPNLGARTFGSESHWIAGQQLTGLAVADFNGDGYPDLTVSNASVFGTVTGQITTLLNTAITAAPNNNFVSGTVVALPSTATYNQAFTVTATLSAAVSGLPAPTGTVQISVDGKFVGTAALVAGVASYNVPGTFTVTVGSGTHVVSAAYSGDSTFAPIVLNGSFITLVPNYITQTALQATPTAITAGQFVTLTATVTADVAVIGGIVTFYDGTSILGQATVSSGTATFQTNLFNIGSNTITAVYQGYLQAGNTFIKASAFQPSTSSAITLPVSANATATALKSSASSISAGTVLTLTATVSSGSTPFGGVTFSDGSTVLGTIALDSTGTATFSSVSLAQGTHNFTASYAANGPFAASSSTATPVIVHISISPLPPAFNYISGISTTAAGTLHVTAQSVSTAGIPATGRVTLLEDGQVISEGTPSATGQADFDIPSGAGVQHAFYASFSGNDSLAPAASPVLLSTGYGALPDFTLSNSAPTAAIFDIGKEISFSLQGTTALSAPVTLSCASGVPAGYSCSFSPLSNGASTLRFVPLVASSRTDLLIFAGCALPLLLVFRRRARWPLLACLALFTLSGCGLNPTSRQAQVVTIQATSGTLLHSVQILVR